MILLDRFFHLINSAKFASVRGFLLKSIIFRALIILPISYVVLRNILTLQVNQTQMHYYYSFGISPHNIFVLITRQCIGRIRGNI